MGTVPTFPTGTAVTQHDLLWWLQYRPLCDAYQASTQSVAATTWTPVTLDTNVIDRDSGHTAGTATYTIGNTLGRYRVSAMVALAPGTSDQYQAKLVLNGSSDVPGSIVTVTSVAAGTDPAVCLYIPPRTVVSTSITDTVQLQCWSGTGGANTVATGAMQSSMFVEYVGNN